MFQGAACNRMLTIILGRSFHQNVLLRPIQNVLRLLQMGLLSTALHQRVPNRRDLRYETRHDDIPDGGAVQAVPQA